ncbi:hypothetical protein [Luteimonas sp. SDU82]
MSASRSDRHSASEAASKIDGSGSKCARSPSRPARSRISDIIVEA